VFVEAAMHAAQALMRLVARIKNRLFIDTAEPAQIPQ
jgi:hypothetical protein